MARRQQSARALLEAFRIAGTFGNGAVFGDDANGVLPVVETE